MLNVVGSRSNVPEPVYDALPSGPFIRKAKKCEEGTRIVRE